jgi:drug/metabolite transporter (DMT)-like permease
MWFLYAIIGAFGKSYSSFFRKKLAKDVSASMFMWISYTVILLLLIPFIISKFDVVINAFSESPIILFAAAASIMLATLMNLGALKREELSYIAPLNAFVPVFTLVIAALLLNEIPPAGGVVGIVIVFAGAYIINLKPNRVRWYDPIKHMFTNVGALLSLGVAFGYAINTVLMKEASNRGYDEFTIMFTITAIGWLLLMYVPILERKKLRKVFGASKVYLLGATISSFAGSFFHILAIAGTYASYAASIRRFDSVISVLLGWRYLKETSIKIKLVGSLVMTFGAIVMAIYK